MGQHPINPIHNLIKDIQQKKELEDQAREADKAMKDIQGPLESYRPGMVINDNQAALFTLPNYLGNVTILNIGAKDVRVGEIASIKLGKNVSIHCTNVKTNEDKGDLVMAFSPPTVQIPQINNLMTLVDNTRNGGLKFNRIWTVTVQAKPEPKIVPPSSTYEECIYAVENTGFVPTVTWGTTPANKQDGSCDQKLCDYWPKKYPNGIPPQYTASARICPAVKSNEATLIAANNSGVQISQPSEGTIKIGQAIQNNGVSAAAQSQVVKSANLIAPVQLDNASTVQLTTIRSSDNREWQCRPVGSNFPDHKPLECPPVDITCSPCENNIKNSNSSSKKPKKSKKTKKTKKTSKSSKSSKSNKSNKSSKSTTVKIAQKDVINQMKAGNKNNYSTKSERFTETFIDLQDDYCYVNLVVGLLIIAIVLHMKGVFQ